MKHLLTALVILLSLVSGACGSDPSVDTPETVGSTDVVLPTGALDIVLQVDERVNQPDPFPIVTSYPPFTLYGDGTIIATDVGAPSGSVPALLRARVSPTGIARLIAEAADADVFGSPDTSHDSTIADADSLRIRANTGVRDVDFAIGDNQGLHDFVDRLEQDWQQIVGDDIVDGPVPYDFESLLVVGMRERSASTADSDVALPVDLRTEGDEYRTRVVPVTCAEMSGDDYELIRAEADRLGRRNGSTWRSGDGLWFVAFRPLLPHEADCEIIANR